METIWSDVHKQTSSTHLHVWMESHRGGPWWTSTMGWKPVFGRGKTMIQQPVPSNRKACLSTHANANTVYRMCFHLSNKETWWDFVCQTSPLSAPPFNIEYCKLVMLCDGSNRGYTHICQVKLLWLTFTIKCPCTLCILKIRVHISLSESSP